MELHEFFEKHGYVKYEVKGMSVSEIIDKIGKRFKITDITKYTRKYLIEQGIDYVPIGSEDDYLYAVLNDLYHYNLWEMQKVLEQGNIVYVITVYNQMYIADRKNKKQEPE